MTLRSFPKPSKLEAPRTPWDLSGRETIDVVLSHLEQICKRVTSLADLQCCLSNRVFRCDVHVLLREQQFEHRLVVLVGGGEVQRGLRAVGLGVELRPAAQQQRRRLHVAPATRAVQRRPVVQRPAVHVRTAAQQALHCFWNNMSASVWLQTYLIMLVQHVSTQDPWHTQNHKEVRWNARIWPLRGTLSKQEVAIIGAAKSREAITNETARILWKKNKDCTTTPKINLQLPIFRLQITFTKTKVLMILQQWSAQERHHGASAQKFLSSSQCSRCCSEEANVEKVSEDRYRDDFRRQLCVKASSHRCLWSEPTTSQSVSVPSRVGCCHSQLPTASSCLGLPWSLPWSLPAEKHSVKPLPQAKRTPVSLRRLAHRFATSHLELWSIVFSEQRRTEQPLTWPHGCGKALSSSLASFVILALAACFGLRVRGWSRCWRKGKALTIVSPWEIRTPIVRSFVDTDDLPDICHKLLTSTSFSSISQKLANLLGSPALAQRICSITVLSEHIGISWSSTSSVSMIRCLHSSIVQILRTNCKRVWKCEFAHHVAVPNGGNESQPLKEVIWSGPYALVYMAMHPLTQI